MCVKYFYHDRCIKKIYTVIEILCHFVKHYMKWGQNTETFKWCLLTPYQKDFLESEFIHVPQ